MWINAPVLKHPLKKPYEEKFTHIKYTKLFRQFLIKIKNYYLTMSESLSMINLAPLIQTHITFFSFIIWLTLARDTFLSLAYSACVISLLSSSICSILIKVLLYIVPCVLNIFLNFQRS